MVPPKEATFVSTLPFDPAGATPEISTWSRPLEDCENPSGPSRLRPRLEVDRALVAEARGHDELPVVQGQRSLVAA
ncbi:MAG: hypothetical protein M5U19_07350 [Microthrixaceae bacterium]|nr:hypothetical protein [Microthrixaceae bacterium]